MGFDRYRISPETEVDLGQYDPRDRSVFDGGKAAGLDRLRELNGQLESLQEILFAESKHKVLIVLQAMDTGGKDGTIRHVFNGTNPQGVGVASFKKPSSAELARDYLWRVHDRVPRTGQITIFNRSHYEDVLVVRVHGLVPEEHWRRRFGHIVEFERLLADEGTTVLKFFLHISKEEQRERLQARLDNPAKHWKFNSADLAERRRWDDYVEAYEEVLSRTSMEWAPWYIIPADRKWYRNLVISEILIDRIAALEPRFPPSEENLDGVEIE